MQRFLVVTFALTNLFHRGAAVNLFKSPKELQTKEYDFVIVGGGTAGSVLANRLSEDSSVTILVVEAGSSHKDHFTAQVPLLPASLVSTAADWNYTTTPQAGFHDRVLLYTRGHALGGSSLVNYMGYNRGSNDTYDRWAKVVQDKQWSSESLEPCYRKNSRLVPPADGRDFSNDILASAHGNGQVKISVGGYPRPVDHRVIEASKELGGRFAFNQDLSNGNFVGTSWTLGTIAGGERDSAATAYLDPLFNACQEGSNVKCRPNLDILIKTHVTKLVQTDDSNGVPAFRAAIVTQPDTPDGPVQITVRKEVILSAGTFGSPKILMQSGIGPAKSLESLDIPVLVDLPSLGQNLTDHILTPMYFTVKEKTTVDPILQDHDIAGQGMKEWTETRKGPFANSAVNTWAFIRLPEDAPILEKVEDPAAGKQAANMEILFSEGFLPVTNIPLPKDGSYMTVMPAIVSPTSRGTMFLTSSDPFAPPTIDPKYLATEFDQFAMVQAMKDAMTYVNSKAFDGYTGDMFGSVANLSTDAELLEYAREHAVTLYHAAGTAKMSPKGADWGVVDPDLTVKKTAGLRIIDASVFPEIPECHTMGPVYILAERAADIIKEAYGLSSEQAEPSKKSAKSSDDIKHEEL